MSMWDDLVSGSVNHSIGLLFKLTGTDAAMASSAFKLGGATLSDLGKALEDGTVSASELESILVPLKSLEGGVFGVALKSFINRVVEYFAR